MLESIVEKYSGLLNGRDVNTLFNHLREQTNRSEAARLCELERRTTYYWQDNREIRLSTKQRVLRATLENDFMFTLKYLCDRAYEVSNETVRLYLGTVYERATDPEVEPLQFRTLLRDFCEARTRFSSLINSIIAPQISHMTRNLRTYSNELGIIFPTFPISTMTVEEIMNTLPSLMKTVPTSIGETRVHELSQSLNFPQEYIKFVSDLKNMARVIHEPSAVSPSDAYNLSQFMGTLKPTIGNISSHVYKNEKDDLENVEISVMIPMESSAPLPENCIMYG